MDAGWHILVIRPWLTEMPREGALGTEFWPWISPTLCLVGGGDRALHLCGPGQWGLPVRLRAARLGLLPHTTRL